MNSQYCNENDTITTRGRIPTHEVHLFRKMLNSLLINKRKKQLLCRRLGYKYAKMRTRNYESMENYLFELFNNHHYSYDKNTRPKKHYTLPPLNRHDIFNEFTSHDFYYLSGFWPDQFNEIVNAMVLIPDKIINVKNGHCSSKKVAFFLMFRRWRKADT